jgi:hypothetical protein
VCFNKGPQGQVGGIGASLGFDSGFSYLKSLNNLHLLAFQIETDQGSFDAGNDVQEMGKYWAIALRLYGPCCGTSIALSASNT